MVVSGNVDGLKKGWLYLQKIEDSVLLNQDSVALRGSGEFRLETTIEHPELFYLYLEKADNNDINDRISFFGEKGQLTINSSWNQFEADAEVSGSKNHEIFKTYMKMMSDFNMRDLSLAQAVFSEANQLKRDSLENLAERNYVNRYRYLLNFAMNNAQSYVTPYIAVTDGREANPVYLDSIYNALPDSVAQSSYGMALKEMLAK